MELVWDRVRVDGECVWVNLREDNKVFESKMAVSQSNMAEFKMAAIIKLSQNEQENFFVHNGWIQDSRIQDGCHHQVESEWMSLSQIELVWVRVLCKMAASKMAEFKMTELKMVAIIKLIRWNETVSEWRENVFEWIWEKITRCLNPRWQCVNPTWQSSRWLPSLSWVRMHEWSSFCANDWIQHGRFQDGCHHQVESEWTSELFCAKWLNRR